MMRGLNRAVRHGVACMSVLLLAGAAPGSAWASGSGEADKLEQGKLLFTTGAAPACAICHTMSDAGAEGPVGPDLDELKPDFQRVKQAVEQGMGAMPPYADSLTAEQIEALATYVSNVTGGGSAQ